MKSQDSEDEVAIRALVQDMSAAWGRGDASAIAKHFQPEGTFTNINGSVFYGQQAFEERHRFLLETAFKGSTAKMTIRRIHFMRTDVALVDVDCALSGGVAPPIESRLLLALGKHGSEWSIAAFHNVDVKAAPVAPSR